MLDSWKAEIPKTSRGVGLLLMIINIFFPGVGTILVACLGSEMRSFNIIIGLLQLLTAAILIGWIWSIWWGCLIYEKSAEPFDQRNDMLV